MIRLPIRIAFSSALLAAVAVAGAQGTAELQQAQERYERQLALCNSGKLPAPEREACVRQAGAALDEARGGPPSSATTRSGDRRSTVVTPEGAPPPAGSTTQRSSDGRSTVVVPANQP